MSDVHAYLYVSFGIVIAVVLPVLVKFIRQQFPPGGKEALPPWLKKYGGLLLFSLVTALPCLAIWKTGHPNQQTGFYGYFLVGFGWESTIEKFLK
jgi:hypothetical protein